MEIKNNQHVVVSDYHEFSEIKRHLALFGVRVEYAELGQGRVVGEKWGYNALFYYDDLNKPLYETLKNQVADSWVAQGMQDYALSQQSEGA
jgi:hypothetical protein